MIKLNFSTKKTTARRLKPLFFLFKTQAKHTKNNEGIFNGKHNEVNVINEITSLNLGHEKAISFT